MARRTAAEAADTRRRVLEVARRAFAEHGFRGASAEAIVAEAGVTRGAMYHHFSDKQALFEAVYRQALAEFDEEITAAGLAAVEATGSLWDAFWAGTDRHLQLCSEPETARIILFEAPVALGWDRWEAIDHEFSVRQFEGILQLLVADGQIADVPITPLAAVLVGAYNHAGRLVALAEDPPSAAALYGATLRELVAGLARPSSGG